MTIPGNVIPAAQIFESNSSIYVETKTHAPGPEGSLPITPEMLLTEPSGNLFGLSQSAGMGWEPARLLDPEYLILSTHGGLRAADGTPIALGFHTGHWEVGLLVAEAARELRAHHMHPVRRSLHRPVRRPHPGHRRHARLAALPQRRGHRPAPPHALAAHAQRRHRRSHVRQRPARHDDGPRLVRTAPKHPCPWRRHAASRRRRRCWQNPVHRRPLRSGPDNSRVRRRSRLPHLRNPRRRLPISRHGRNVAGRRRSARVVAAALRARTVRPAYLARRSNTFRSGNPAACRNSAWAQAMFSPTPRSAMP